MALRQVRMDRGHASSRHVQYGLYRWEAINSCRWRLWNVVHLMSMGGHADDSFLDLA